VQFFCRDNLELVGKVKHSLGQILEEQILCGRCLWSKKKMTNIVLIFNFWKRNFFGWVEFLEIHSALWRFVLESYTRHQLSSLVIMDSKKFSCVSLISSKSCAWESWCCRCLAVNVCGTKRAHSFLFFKSFLIICCTMVFWYSS